jgi:hypothetical protein
MSKHSKLVREWYERVRKVRESLDEHTGAFGYKPYPKSDEEWLALREEVIDIETGIAAEHVRMRPAAYERLVGGGCILHREAF